jgi:hypothetical protein
MTMTDTIDTKGEPAVDEVRTVVRKRLGADGRSCQETVVQYLGELEWREFPGHAEDSMFSRRVLWEEVVAWSQCEAEEVDQAEFAAIRAKREAEMGAVKESAAKARAVVGDARADAIATLAKNAGLTAEQTEALFGRSPSPAVKEAVEAAAKKR